MLEVAGKLQILACYREMQSASYLPGVPLKELGFRFRTPRHGAGRRSPAAG
jgi:hypothetical protein